MESRGSRGRGDRGFRGGRGARGDRGGRGDRGRGGVQRGSSRVSNIQAKKYQEKAKISTYITLNKSFCNINFNF